jgi:hypothetical protein
MSPAPLLLRLHSGGQHQVRSTAPVQLVLASWTGRHRPAMEARLRELEALGVARPPSMPVFYRVAAARVTTAALIEVIGDTTSGEVEFVLARLNGRLWIGVGSDHTDRSVEAQGAAQAKQLCEKPVCADFWAFEDLVGHWDQLVLRSYVVEGHERKTYQEGAVGAMLPPSELLALWADATDSLQDNAFMFCGTLPTIGPLCASSRFEFELEDPVLGRRLVHGYEVRQLPLHVMPVADRLEAA